MEIEKKLPVEFKTKWVEALRSGKYEQVTGVLRSKNGFCCLGVACDIVNSETWTRFDDPDFADYMTKPGSEYLLCDEDVPPEVFEVLRQEIANDDPKDREDYQYVELQTYLSNRNDRGWTFEKLANFIEENL